MFFKKIIPVYEKDIFGGSLCYPIISGIGKTAVFFPVILKTGISRGIASCNKRALVSGAVINHDGAEIAVGLTGNTFQTCSKLFLNIINRNYDIEFHEYSLAIHLLAVQMSHLLHNLIWLNKSITIKNGLLISPISYNSFIFLSLPSLHLFILEESPLSPKYFFWMEI